MRYSQHSSACSKRKKLDMLMKEIIINPDQELGLDQVMIDNLTPTGKSAEGFEIYRSELGKIVTYALMDEDEKLAILVTRKVKRLPGKNKDVLLESRMWVYLEHRGKGYAPLLYSAIPRIFDIILMSDQYLSANALKVWQKLERSKINTVTFFKASNDGGFTDVRPEDDPNVRFVLECETDRDYMNFDSKIISEQKFFTKGKQ